MAAAESAGFIAIAAGLVMGVTAIATAWAQKEIGTAAVGAAAENDKMFGRGLMYMVIPETIVLFGLVIAFMLIQKIS
ncbi:MAG: V-type ATP synthase subunit K [Euryarchaeota archaeon]|nr:V-type ATP synthase subunit K [Euryarchaeota archaeon]